MSSILSFHYARTAFFTLFICSLLTGCNSKETTPFEHNYQFHGESTHWAATILFSGKGKTSTHYDENQKSFLLEYKGDYEDIAHSVVSYNYKSSGESEGGSESPPGTKYIRTSSKGTGGDIQDKDEIIKVTVKWDGKKEVIPMKITSGK
ncbi:hypothetical protein [Bacillus sp. X1(2014)]|uniref:hypothetical protein n=1 Tax=Bacillus sp. X1(2014) TaxID=1565991 RepID=UPI0011A75FE2|nr:hypothetical protein [Bacillus sp. X1(2014)]